MPRPHTRSPYSQHTGMTTSYLSTQDGEFHYPDADGVEHFDARGRPIRPEGGPNARDNPLGYVDRRQLVDLTRRGPPRKMPGMIRGPPGANPPYVPVLPGGIYDGAAARGGTGEFPMGIIPGPPGAGCAPIGMPPAGYGGRAPQNPPAYPSPPSTPYQPSPNGGEGEVGPRIGSAAGKDAETRGGQAGVAEIGAAHPSGYHYVDTDPSFATGRGPRAGRNPHVPYDATGQPYYHDFGDGYHQNRDLAYAATHRHPFGATWRPRRGGVHPIYRDPAVPATAGYGGRGPRYPGAPFFDPATHPLGGGYGAVPGRDSRYPTATHLLGGGHGGHDPRYPTATYFDPAIHTLAGGLGGRGPRAPGTMVHGPAANGIGAVGSIPDRSHGAAAPIPLGPQMGGYAGGNAAMAGRVLGDGAQQPEQVERHPDCTCPRGGPTA